MGQGELLSWCPSTQAGPGWTPHTAGSLPGTVPAFPHGEVVAPCSSSLHIPKMVPVEAHGGLRLPSLLPSH